MEGDKNRRVRGRTATRSERNEKLAMESDDGVDANSPSPRRLDTTEAGLLANIHTEIRAMRADVKKELCAHCHKLREDVKNDLAEFREEINQTLGNIREDLKTTTTRVDEAEQRVADIEEFNTEFEVELLQMKQAQESMQIKVADLELRSRRNNIRIYGIPEGEEEN